MADQCMILKLIQLLARVESSLRKEVVFFLAFDAFISGEAGGGTQIIRSNIFTPYCERCFPFWMKNSPLPESPELEN